MITRRSKILYTNPEFQKMIDSVPMDIARRVDLSFDIAERIYEILQRKGWSQDDFARSAGKRKDVIRKWLSGHCNFDLMTIAFIETVLGEGILSVRKYRKSGERM